MYLVAELKKLIERGQAYPGGKIIGKGHQEAEFFPDVED